MIIFASKGRISLLCEDEKFLSLQFGVLLLFWSERLPIIRQTQQLSGCATAGSQTLEKRSESLRHGASPAPSVRLPQHMWRKECVCRAC